MHYHSDHFGGLPYLLDHFEIGRVFDNSFEPLNAYGSTEVDSGKRCLFNWEKNHPGAVTRYLVEGDKIDVSTDASSLFPEKEKV